MYKRPVLSSGSGSLSRVTLHHHHHLPAKKNRTKRRLTYIMRLNTIVFLLATAAATAVSAQGNDDKPPASHGVAFPKPDETHVLDLRNNGGLNGLPAPLFTVRKWERGFIPYACNQAAAGQNACGAMDIEVWNVTFADVSIFFSFFLPLSLLSVLFFYRFHLVIEWKRSV
jgi:hypothetical protein